MFNEIEIIKSYFYIGIIVGIVIGIVIVTGLLCYIVKENECGRK